MKWIKCSERPMPEGVKYQKAHIKYKGSADLLVFITGWCWLDESSLRDSIRVNDDSWSAIEWLDESPSDVEADAVGFAEWVMYQGFERYNEDGLWHNNTKEDLFPMGDIKPPIKFTTTELYHLYKTTL